MLELHVDDYHCWWPREQLEALQADIEKFVMVKEYSTHDPKGDEECEHSQRKRHVKHDGTCLCRNPSALMR